jgi:hypothetical protein
MLALTARQRDQFCADGLCDGIQFALAQVRLEEFHVRALHAHDGKARPPVSFTYVPALTHKDFSHLSKSFLACFGHIPKIIIRDSGLTVNGQTQFVDTPLYPLAITAQSAIMQETGSGRHDL